MRILFLLLIFPMVGYGQFTDATFLFNNLDVVRYSSTNAFGSGTSFYDFNHDGWDDLTITGVDENNNVLPIIFLVNNEGTFEIADFNIPHLGDAPVHALLWADYDNDGDADLFISRYGGPMELWQNDGDFNFTNVTFAAGLDNSSKFHAGACFGDYNHNGCLDLYVTRYYTNSDLNEPGFTNILYRNNCDGTFTDVTMNSGVYLSPRATLQPAFVDVNNDGWEDLFLAIDRQNVPNELFLNNGDGSFTRVTETAGVETYMDAMSATVGDYNHSGYLDIYVTNNPIGTGNALYENNGDGNFTDRGPELEVNLMLHGWGALWLDYNNNSWQDLIVTNMYDGVGLTAFINEEGQSFTDSTYWMGGEAFISETFVLAMGDINNDGYSDFISNSIWPYKPRLYQNNGGDNNYIAVTLQGTLANRDGVGSWIRAYVNGEELLRYTLCGENLHSQNSRKQIIGIGNATQVDSLVIDWNSGTCEVYLQPAINTHHYYIEGASFTQPFALSYSGSAALCPGDSLVLYAPDNQSYLWNTGDTTQSISVSQAGSYYVEAWNAFGLSAFSDTIVVTEVPQAQVQFEVQHVSCAGAMDGSVLAQISTGPLQEIIWNTGATDSLIQQLGGGIYSFSALDPAGCAVSGKVSLNEPPPLAAQAITTNVLCFGENTGTAEINVIGGTPPYAAEWNNADPIALPAGNYEIVITDAQNCEKVLNFEITEPDSLWVTFETGPASGGNNGWASAEAHGGTPPYEWQWSTGESGVSEIINLAAGNYSLTITDGNDCAFTAGFTISNTTGLHEDHAQALKLFPNPTTHDALLEGCLPGSELLLFDVFGREIARQRITNCPFHIRTNGLPAGQYLLIVNSGHASQHLRLVVVN